ncbi:unnamed protein product [Peniophora sp. CBMAI 1063]|nr:unnamed protein product [Peniophora sp. CBMAI 1063]
MGDYCGSRCKNAASEFQFGLEAPQKIFHDGRWYPDAYTLYVARKFAGPVADKISQCGNAREAKKLIWAYEEAGLVERRPDWEEVKDDILQDVLRLKFGRSHQLRMALKGIEQRFIVADMPRDPWLGNGSDGRGQNKLGKALTRLRDALQDDIFA